MGSTLSLSLFSSDKGSPSLLCCNLRSARSKQGQVQIDHRDTLR